MADINQSIGLNADEYKRQAVSATQVTDQLEAATKKAEAAISRKVAAEMRAAEAQRLYREKMDEALVTLNAFEAGEAVSESAVAKATATLTVATAELEKYAKAQGIASQATLGMTEAQIAQTSAMTRLAAIGAEMNLQAASLGRTQAESALATQESLASIGRQMNIDAFGMGVKSRLEKENEATKAAVVLKALLKRTDIDLTNAERALALQYVETGEAAVASAQKAESGWLRLSGRVGISTAVLVSLGAAVSAYQKMDEAAMKVAQDNEKIAEGLRSLAMQDILSKNPQQFEKYIRMGVQYGVSAVDAADIAQTTLGVTGATDEDVRAAMILKGQVGVDKSAVGLVAAAGAGRGVGAAYAANMADYLQAITPISSITTAANIFPSQSTFTSLGTFGATAAGLSMAQVPEGELPEYTRIASRILRDDTSGVMKDRRFGITKDMNEVQRVMAIKASLDQQNISEVDYTNPSYWQGKYKNTDYREAFALSKLLTGQGYAGMIKGYDEFSKWGPEHGMPLLKESAQQLIESSPQQKAAFGSRQAMIAMEAQRYLNPIGRDAERAVAEKQAIAAEFMRTSSPAGQYLSDATSGEANFIGRAYYHAIQSGEPWRAFSPGATNIHSMQPDTDWFAMRASQAASIANQDTMRDSTGQQLVRATEETNNLLRNMQQPGTSTPSASGAQPYQPPAIVTAQRNAGN